MRKKIISISILLPILLGIGIFDMIVTNGTTEACVAFTEEARACIQAADYAGAEAALSAVEQRYQRSEWLLRIWETHADVDAVVLAIKCAKNGVFLEDMAVAMEYTSQLLQAFTHLDHQDDFSFMNVF